MERDQTLLNNCKRHFIAQEEKMYEKHQTKINKFENTVWL